jgi:hypothetical protein
MLLAVTLFIQLESAIGVGLVPGNGDPCISLPEPRLAAGSTVTLVHPDRPQSVLTAKIEESLTSCRGLEGALIAGPYYRLGQFSNTPQPQSIWLVFKGNVTSRSTRNGDIALRLNATHPTLQVRSCTSSEGLHLTVWSGQPLKSRRLWHAYYYLGYDVAPSCTDADTK